MMGAPVIVHREFMIAMLRLVGPMDGQTTNIIARSNLWKGYDRLPDEDKKEHAKVTGYA